MAYAIDDSKAILWEIFIIFIYKERFQKCTEHGPVYIRTNTVGNEAIDAYIFLNGKGATDNIRRCGIKHCSIFLAVRIIGSSLKVERDNGTAADLIFYSVHRGHIFITCIHA